MSDAAIISAIVSAFATVLVGYLAYRGVRSGHMAEERKKQADEWQAREDRLWTNVENQIGELRAQVSEQAKQIQLLTDRLNAKDEQISEQSRLVRELQDREQDREELLADYREHTLAHQLWLDDGGNPPSPTRSWRIRMDLEQAQQERR